MRRAMSAAALPPPFPLLNPNLHNLTKQSLFFSTHSSSPTRRFSNRPINFTRTLTISSSSSSSSSHSSALELTCPSPPHLPLSPSSSSTVFGLEHYLACSMPGKRLKVAVLLSGGVDSSVALRLLHAAGHSCTAFYLKIWFQVFLPLDLHDLQGSDIYNVVYLLLGGLAHDVLSVYLQEDFENFWSECPWDEDLKYARAVCDQIDVPLEVVHLSDEYWKNVVSHIIGEYQCGRTPNPDVLCNTRIKFGAFVDAIENMEFDYIASGHYAHVVHSSSDQRDGSSVLALSKDMVKDQTYFLSHLSQFQLRRLLFPLGCASKDEVRRLATFMDLPNKDRKDSQGICFLGKVKFSEFVAKHIGEREGVLLEAETGDYLGKHKGFWFYTIGQRQGLRLPGGPWYVVEKDVQNNVVFVSRDYFSLDKRRRTFRVGSLKWVSGSPPAMNDQLRCKVRHGPGFYNCSTAIGPSEDGHEEVMVVHISEDDQGLAAGQFAAFYREETCIGSGVILDSWDGMSFPVCLRALEIAKMADKSNLGKPVRIMNQETDCKGSIQLHGNSEHSKHIITNVSQRQVRTSKVASIRSSVSWWQKLRETFLRIF